MSFFLNCPTLEADVELGEEREKHISARHPDLLPELRSFLIETVSNPDAVRPSARQANAKLFSKFYPELMSGKYVVVVVVTESMPQRHWIVTAYLTRKLATGE